MIDLSKKCGKITLDKVQTYSFGCHRQPFLLTIFQSCDNISVVTI